MTLAAEPVEVSRAPRRLSPLVLVGGLVAAEAFTGMNLVLAWKAQVGLSQPVRIHGLDPAAARALVAIVVLAVPLIAAHLAWMLSRSDRSALMAAALAAYFERYAALIRHGAENDLVAFGLQAAAVWVLAMAGGKAISVALSAVGGGLMAASLAMRPVDTLAYVVGAIGIVAVVSLVRGARRQWPAAVAFAATSIAGIALTTVAQGETWLVEPTLRMTGRLAPASLSLDGVTAGAYAVARNLVELGWRLGGLVTLACLVYLAPSFRLAVTRGHVVRWCAVMLPFCLLIVEALSGTGRWYAAVTAVLPIVVLPALIWRTV